MPTPKFLNQHYGYQWIKNALYLICKSPICRELHDISQGFHRLIQGLNYIRIFEWATKLWRQKGKTRRSNQPLTGVHEIPHPLRRLILFFVQIWTHLSQWIRLWVKFRKLWFKLANVIGVKWTVDDSADNCPVVVGLEDVVCVWNTSFDERNCFVIVKPLTTQALSAERYKFISAISYLIGEKKTKKIQGRINITENVQTILLSFHQSILHLRLLLIH